MANEIFIKALNDVVTAECAGLMEYESEHIFSDEFEHNMRRLVARQKKIYFRMVNTARKRVACAAVVMLIGTFAAVMNVEAVRSAIAEFFIDVYAKFSNFTSAEDEAAPKKIEEIYEITYGLDGYTVDFEVRDDFMYRVSYTNGTNIINYQQNVKCEYDANWNTEGAAIEIITINGYEAVYFCNKDYNYHHLIWSAEDYIFSVSGNIDKNELIKMAKSVQKVE